MILYNCSFTMFYFRCFILLFVTIATCDKPPQVRISLGNIEGEEDTNIKGGVFYSFEGVPYADPPIGKLRFEEPVPSTSWEGTWKADTRYKCMQYDSRAYPTQVIGTEDCLYLNIYTPKLKGKLDVIVYIEGAGFISGERSLPHIIMTNDVVFVTMNYRLGVFGFLSTEDFRVPGNNGLKDQILALKWIQKHIEHFGGNPNSVTIFGVADGAASVHYHYVSPKSKGLFHKGISMSGCLLNPWVLKVEPLNTAKELARNLDCNLERAPLMLACLKQTSAEKLTHSTLPLQFWDFGALSAFGIVIDKWSTDPMLPQHPMSILRGEVINDVPWMSSQTDLEGLIASIEYTPMETLDSIKENWHLSLPKLLLYDQTAPAEHHSLIDTQILDHYIGECNELTEANFISLTELFGDRFFRAGIDMCTKNHAASSRAPVYHYVFSYKGQHSWSDVKTHLKRKRGACHADDLSYVLAGALNSQTTEEDRKISRLMVDIIVSFAKNGKPKIQHNWPEVMKNFDKPIKYLDISSNPKVEERHFGNRRFWESLSLIENELIYLRNTKTEL